MVVKLIRLIFYLVITFLYIYAFDNDTKLFDTGKYDVMGFPFDNSFGRRAKFLTYIDMTIQIAFFGLSFFIVLGELTLAKLVKPFAAINSKLAKLQNTVHVSLAFPIGSYVTGMFWILYFVDRKLVYPVQLDTIIPVWQNHVMHTLPLIGVVLETILNKHKYPSFINGARYTILFILSYLSWTLYIAYESDQWVYGVLRELDTFYRGLFILAQLFIVCLFYQLGSFLNRVFNPSSSRTRKVD